MRESPLGESADELEKKAYKPPSEAEANECGYYGFRGEFDPPQPSGLSIPLVRDVGVLAAHERLDGVVGE